MGEAVVEVDLDALRDRSGAQVIDVREPDEYAQGHVPGAMSMPLSGLLARVSELDGDRQVLVLCASGNRSRVGAELLCSAGLDAVSVAGGTRAWELAGRAVERGHS